MGLRVGDIFTFSYVNCVYEVMDIDTSRPILFELDGVEFKQEILFRNPNGCVNTFSWAGSLDLINKSIADGTVIILNRNLFEPRMCGIKKLKF